MEREAIKLAKEIFKKMKDKPAHPHCRKFRKTCFLFHPQPDCEDCKYLDVFAMIARKS